MDSRAAFKAFSALGGNVSEKERELLITRILDEPTAVLAASVLVESSISLTDSEREQLLLHLDVKQATRLREMDNSVISEAELEVITERFLSNKQ